MCWSDSIESDVVIMLANALFETPQLDPKSQTTTCEYGVKDVLR